MSYVVEEIVGEDVNLMGDEYVRVKWAGYPSSYNSWILKSSILEGGEIDEGGVQQTGSVERGNYISASDAVANVPAYRSLVAYSFPDVVIDSYYYQRLDIKAKNYVLIWTYNDHLYVVAVFRGQVYLADGVDNCHLNSKARGLIRRLVSWKINLGSVGTQQSGDDHCGSSAVLIALEYLRMMGKGEVCERILLPVGLKQKLVRKLHPNKTIGRAGEPSQIRSNVEELVCRHCQASHRKKGSTILKMHESKCRVRPLS